MRITVLALTLLVANFSTAQLNQVFAEPNVRIIDAHEHIQSINEASALREINDNLGISKTILVASPAETLGTVPAGNFSRYHENNEAILSISKKFPDQFIPFCTLDTRQAFALSYLKKCLSNGGKGLKLYNGHSQFYDVLKGPLDNPRLDPLYSFLNGTELPVLYHINIAKYEEELNRLLKKFPKLRIEIPHFMVSSANLTRVSEFFNKYPNLYTDISFGAPEFMADGLLRISHQHEEFTEFFTTYAERILFGADIVITSNKTKNPEMIKDILQCYISLLEKDYYACKPMVELYSTKADATHRKLTLCQKRGKMDCLPLRLEYERNLDLAEESSHLQGLELPPEILNQIFETNADRFLKTKI